MAESYASPEVAPVCRRLSAGGVVTYWIRHSSISSRLFPNASEWCQPPTFRLEALRGLIFRSGPPPQRSFASRSCPPPFGGELTYLGFRPSSRPDQNASTSRRTFPSPTTFRPQAFSASRRFTPRFGARACFISLPRPGFSSVQGLLPSRSLSLLVAESFPLAVSRPPAHAPESTLPRSNASASRLCST